MSCFSPAKRNYTWKNNSILKSTFLKFVKLVKLVRSLIFAAHMKLVYAVCFLPVQKLEELLEIFFMLILTIFLFFLS